MKVRELLLHNRLFRHGWQRYELWRWRWASRPASPPHLFKQSVVRDYARRFALRIFVETGTYHGEMLATQKEFFNQLFSIELDRQLYRRARKRFALDEHVFVVPGDSAFVLPFVLNKVSGPALFWLDAHAMIDGVQGELLTPIREELRAILEHGPLSDDVILIDDARLFGSAQDYPSVREVEEIVHHYYPRWYVGVEDDIIRIHQ